MMFANLLSSYAYTVPFGDEEAYVYENVWTDYATDFMTTVFLFAALALAVILAGIALLVYFKKRESLPAFLKTGGAIACGFIITVIVCMLALGYAKIAEKGYAEYTDILGFVLAPSTVLGGVIVLGSAAVYICNLFSQKAFKISLIAALSALGAAAVSLLICLTVYFFNGVAEENNGAVITTGENVALFCTSAGLIAVIVALAVFFGKGKKSGFDSKSIAYAAVCIAASFALSYIKFIQMPQGGSITLVSLLPLMLYSYMFGVRKGVFAGAVYGVLQAVQEPFLIHPAQFLLDYPVAFAAIGITGIFADVKKLENLPQIKFALGGIAASLLRFISHVLSGVFAFSEYSTLDNVWVYSMAYNSFVFVDIAITIAAGVIILSVNSFKREVNRIKAAAEEHVNEEHANEV